MDEEKIGIEVYDREVENDKVKENGSEKSLPKFDIEKVSKQLYEISFVHYIQEGENWVSVMCKYAEFGVLGEILLKLYSRYDYHLVTDIKLIEPDRKEVKNEIN